MKKSKYQNFPFRDVTRVAEGYVRQGMIVIQKWTCAGCGARLCGGPNTWTTHGRCDEVEGKMGCGTVTNLEKTGCNYTLMLATSPKGAANIDQILAAIRPKVEGPQ